MKTDYIISPSILSADFSRLGEQILAVEEAGAGWIHIDVMDGHFVPNITMGPFIVETCRRITNLPLDVHLMIDSPHTMVEAFAKAGADILYVHVENSPNLHNLLTKIKSLGCRPGLVINPGTSALLLEPVLHLVDVVIVMSVNPGYSGQTFIPEVTPKIAQIRKMMNLIKPEAVIAVDGGMTKETLPPVIQAGAQVIIAASAVFKHPEGIAAGMEALRSCFPD
jgi:ribulose-phosphate 3-epimerase